MIWNLKSWSHFPKIHPYLKLRASLTSLCTSSTIFCLNCSLPLFLYSTKNRICLIYEILQSHLFPFYPFQPKQCFFIGPWKRHSCAGDKYRDHSICLRKTTHVWEFPLITWTSMCVGKTTQMWFLPNTWDLSKCLVKTTHVCENPHMCVYFQIQGGIFCICICIWQISLKYLTSYTYLSFQIRRPKILIWE